MKEPTEVERAVSDAHRNEWATVLAATLRLARNLDLAEDCVQEAYAAALVSWARDGIPSSPAAWLITAAKRRVMDAMRRETSLRAKLPLLIEPEETGHGGAETHTRVAEIAEETVPDERLRLIFLCCHPALAPEAQMALTLRLVCGVSTADIARAFLVSDPTMGARLTRAKGKISAARIPLRMPRAAELPDRLQTVLGVIYLLFTMGHTAPSGTSLMRLDLVREALHLTRTLRKLMPHEREIGGLLALLLATTARSATRVDVHGQLQRLAEQDRSQWDRSAIAEAHDLIAEGLRGGPPERYVLQAAIALLYAEAPTYDQTDWSQIVRLYEELLAVWPSPVVALNRAVALSMALGPAAALAEVEKLEKDGRLAGYVYLPAIRADLLHRLGRTVEASRSIRLALDLVRNEAEREFLAARLGDFLVSDEALRGNRAPSQAPEGRS